MSIGTKFNLVALGIPVVLLVVFLGLIYSFTPNLFQPFLLLVGALIALDGVVWNRLRTQVETKMHNVWDNYLKPVRDTVSGAVVGSTYFFPDRRGDLEVKMSWVAKYGKYGPLKLYPSKLVNKKLVSTLLTVAEDFNLKLTNLFENEKTSGREFHLYYAFDHWGFREIPPEQIKGLDPKMTLIQNTLLGTLDETKKEEIASLKEPWEKGLSLSKQIVSILNKFSSENGIMPPKPPGNPFG